MKLTQGRLHPLKQLKNVQNRTTIEKFSLLGEKKKILGRLTARILDNPYINRDREVTKYNKRLYGEA